MEEEKIDVQAYAMQKDQEDPLKGYRNQFYLPKQANGEPYVYFCGNSLGLQPKSVKEAVNQELLDWQNLGVEGHLQAKNPWLPYHEYLTPAMAKMVGAKEHEVVVMNTLSVNLHLMMVSFYQPKGDRNKILIESDAFPSDRYAVTSQIRYHGLDPTDCLIALAPRTGEHCLRPEDIAESIKQHGDSIALILIGNTNYYTGQYFDMKAITKLGHDLGCTVGFDCAHAAGNVALQLHDSGADFAVWCSYKYLNAGPGSIGACFVHERHGNRTDLPKFTGWWGHNKETRFGMRDAYDPIPGAESWQLSNPPILSIAAVWASLKLFDEVGMDALTRKSLELTGYLLALIDSLDNPRIEVLTPLDPNQRGSQVSIRVKDSGKSLFDELYNNGIIADWREPDVIRVAPVPFYNTFQEVFMFVEILKSLLVDE